MNHERVAPRAVAAAHLTQMALELPALEHDGQRGLLDDAGGSEGEPVLCGHLVAWLPDGADEATIAARARGRGVAIHTLHHDSAAVAPVPPALLLGYASLSEDALRRAAHELALAVRAAG